ncbi:SDR family oxidoreductase [Paraburkholderia sp. BR10937]|uniref:SDR family oxidoreductase n=1 Tax=Paraburkholderia sp. BR10937 TaxID=3236994 RepID=UPI0034D372A5
MRTRHRSEDAPIKRSHGVSFGVGETKASVIGMTIPVARDLVEYGIRVLSIAPGLFETGMSAGMPAKVSDGLIEKMLFPRRIGHAGEFGALVRHLVESAYMNALTVDIDCGTR